MTHARHSSTRSKRILWAAVGAVVLGAAGCGGQDISNPPGETGQKLSFIYYQRCVEPVLQATLQVNQAGNLSTATCASGGCHSSVSGTGGALRLVPGAATIDPGSAADLIRASDVYKNFYSAQGSSLPGAPTQSRLLTKPLLLNVLHGGGQIFASQSDPNARLIAYWISRPVPEGQDEFSSAADSMFTPENPTTGTCNTN